MSGTFRLACGDVMPGCTAVFERGDRGSLMQAVAAHATRDHGLVEVTPAVATAVEARVVHLPRPNPS